MLKRLILLALVTFSTASAFTTRPATENDVDVVYDLICELAQFEGKNPNNLPLTKENLLHYGFGEHPYYCIELAEKEGRVVGYALYSYGFSGHQGKPFLYLDDLYVQPSERGQGIGSALLKQLATQAKSLGCCRLEWLAFDWNDRAIEYYEKLGGKLRRDLLLIRTEKEAYHQIADGIR
ncbi:MAG: GNAT family N-acetyltransferase [Simkaniaceae bacterium]|nr:GNAT family N-acetyltransferase [Simkaniaceae bacterium]